ncbi:MAG TPA: DUF2846 domain-containing protein [Caulobacteraceae bacterium]|nr:DUF2846 domain-containing protein [Caulobacteraceae bacterium]
MNGLKVVVAAGAVLAAAGSSVGAWAAMPACCRVPAHAAVAVELVGPVSTRTQHDGDSFALQLSAPLIVNGRVVLKAGTPGVGKVIQSSGPGFGGKAAKLVLAARYLEVGKRHIALQGLQMAMSGAGKDNVAAAQAIGISGIVLGPVGFVGMAVRGGNVDFPAGTRATAQLAAGAVLPPLGRPTKAERELAAQVLAAPSPAEGPIAIPPPPSGKGQIVFFRPHSLLGTGQWFNVRENGAALGKLTNGAYFVQTVDPGLHTYTATEEPEFKDSLNLQVDPGDTYYVQGALTKGVVLGAADLIPSDRAAFEKAADGLKPAETQTAAK